MSSAGRPYTENDRANIVLYIIQHRAYHRICKLSLYEEMVRDQVVIGRTTYGLYDQVRDVISKNFRKYCDEKNAEILERMWRDSKKKTSVKKSNNNVIDSTGQSKLSSFMSKTSQDSSKAGPITC